MKAGLKKFLETKREWTEPLTPEDIERGFKGWYASKNLPHFDVPGTQQFITYRLEDSMPAAPRSEWEAFLHLEDKQEQQRKIEAYLDRGLGQCHLGRTEVAQIVQNSLWHYDGVQYQLHAWVIMPTTCMFSSKF